MKKKLDPRSEQQVKTTKERYGEDHYSKTGKKGAQKRWAAYRALKEMEADGKNS